MSKKKTPRDPKYLAWIGTLICLSCQKPAPSDPHHEGPRGIGIKASDYDTVPLCRECHDRRHRIGKLSFWGNTNLETVKERLRALYRKEI